MAPQSEPGPNCVFALYDVLLYLQQMTKLAQRIHFLFPYVAYTQCIKCSRECDMGRGRLTYIEYLRHLTCFTSQVLVLSAWQICYKEEALQPPTRSHLPDSFPFPSNYIKYAPSGTPSKTSSLWQIALKQVLILFFF